MNDHALILLIDSTVDTHTFCLAIVWFVEKLLELANVLCKAKKPPPEISKNWTARMFASIKREYDTVFGKREHTALKMPLTVWTNKKNTQNKKIIAFIWSFVKRIYFIMYQVLECLRNGMENQWRQHQWPGEHEKKHTKKQNHKLYHMRANDGMSVSSNEKWV